MITAANRDRQCQEIHALSFSLRRVHAHLCSILESCADCFTCMCVRAPSAAEAALASRDLDMLASIQHKCTNPADMALLDNMIAQSGLA